MYLRFLFFFFNDTATTEIYTLSLHDALPIYFHLVHLGSKALGGAGLVMTEMVCVSAAGRISPGCAGLYRSEEHTSELQSHLNLVCRLLLEKKKNNMFLTRVLATHYYYRS